MKRLLISLVLMFALAGVALADAPSIAWHNYKSGQTEYVHGMPSEEKMREFIPQIAPAQGLYDVYIALGKTPAEAAILVLEAVIGERK